MLTKSWRGIFFLFLAGILLFLQFSQISTETLVGKTKKTFTHPEQVEVNSQEIASDNLPAKIVKMWERLPLWNQYSLIFLDVLICLYFLLSGWFLELVTLVVLQLIFYQYFF